MIYYLKNTFFYIFKIASRLVFFIFNIETDNAQYLLEVINYIDFFIIIIN